MEAYPWKSIYDIRNEIEQFRKETPVLSWERIGDFYSTPETKITGAHIWKIAKENYEPHRPDIRAALGMPAMTTIIVMNGNAIPSGSQVLHAEFCKCGQPYISNHPLRKRCFKCSPYRGKK